MEDLVKWEQEEKEEEEEEKGVKKQRIGEARVKKV